MAYDVERQFHESWIGMVQPAEGLVVSLPVLLDAQVYGRHPATLQEKLRAELVPGESGPAIRDLRAFLASILGLTPDLFDVGETIPEAVSLYVPEGGQTIRPTLALKRQDSPAPGEPPYELLVWDLHPHVGLSLDKPETSTGPWEYPPAAKFDRLLRHTRIPIGLLTNRDEIRLIYAPHGESSGSLPFRLRDMEQSGGRPILDAFVQLLSAHRLFGAAPERRLPRILEDSRRRQADVTNTLANQVFEALSILLSGFEAAAERDGRRLLDDAVGRDDDHAYGGLLTVLLRLVFLLYAEDRGLLPVEHPHYAENLSVLELFERLQEDHGAYPDSMSRRFGAWPRLVALFRAIYLGVSHGDLEIPARRGVLFDPNEFPFLEGWGPAGSAPVKLPEQRAAVNVPTVDDETVFRVLERLLVLDGQRLSYRALDVEQIGSVYEALMGYHVYRVGSPAVCLRGSKTWIAAADLLEEPAARRAAWLEDEAALSKSEVKKISSALAKAKDEDDALEALEPLRVKALSKVDAGKLVLQPGTERRRTSSHYTPRSLSGPIVRRTLEPLLAAMGENPASERLLNLKICDPAMGSGAFLVEACRFLADQVVAAWTREGTLAGATKKGGGDPVNHAKRLVAQRCLYGVDKNAFAVNLAKLSLWLVTLAKDEPFTFVDHALRHGDSLVGLDLDQIRAFHWSPGKEPDLFANELKGALAEALEYRQEILTLAHTPGPEATRQKSMLLKDAEVSLERARLIADLCVGAFFDADTDKARKLERSRRLAEVVRWLSDAKDAPPAELVDLRESLRAMVPAFHWMLEFPEVFYGERPDPLEAEQANRAAWMDAFIGNPPFLGGRRISGEFGASYSEWLETTHRASKNADLVAHFFRRAFALLGAHGSLGLIGTNTLAEGDTREVGLAHIVGDGGIIYAAQSSQPWPGEAAVAVAIVFVAKGSVAEKCGPRDLDGKVVDLINSRIAEGAERAPPRTLLSNADLSFQGSILAGSGFVLEPKEAKAFAVHEQKRIRPYLGGEEVNTNPDQGFDRYVIDFGDMSLEEAEEFPTLLKIVRDRVKPLRDEVNREAHRRYWWQFGDKRPALYSHLAKLERCLVCSRVTKHLVFARQPTDRVFSEALCVFVFDDFSRFSVLQSRTHECWARLLSSSLEDRLRYSVSDCFETFPFPHSFTTLEKPGEAIHNLRAVWMSEQQLGLTELYNRLKDVENTDDVIVALRNAHEDLDRAVLAAYGWSDIPVPPYTATAGDPAFESFSDAVLNKLFALNAERAEQERLLGAASDSRSKRLTTNTTGETKQMSLGDLDAAASTSKAKRKKG